MRVIVFAIIILVLSCASIDKAVVPDEVIQPSETCQACTTDPCMGLFEDDLGQEVSCVFQCEDNVLHFVYCEWGDYLYENGESRPPEINIQL